ncbi:MAG: efflux RND transporter periplasmic adaptor subunit [Deltaproteobacteria bacterium]|nr:efflux RND transporter periplasmic adaptor subunit [Deltaproteobacteria bacterium]
MKSRSRKVWAIVGGASVLTLVCLWGFARPSGSPTSEGPVADTGRDVPRIEGKAVVFSEAFAQRAGIKLAPVKQAPLTPVVKVVGAVDFNPRQVAAVGARIQGFVRRVLRLPGDVVKAGEALAEIESATLGQAQADLSATVAHKQAAHANAERENALLKQGLTTAREAEVANATLASHEASLEAARQRVVALGGASAGGFGTYTLRSPLNGTVVESHISVGQSVEANLVAFRVANLDDLWIDLSVFERSIGAVRVGDYVEVTPMADVKKIIKGKVAHVSEILDMTTRSGTVRVQVDNRNRLLRPGQSVAALIHTATPTRKSLLVPFDAITYVDGAPTVFVAHTTTKVMPTVVQLGMSDGEQQEVVSGLTEGQQVVVEGVFALKSELFR